MKKNILDVLLDENDKDPIVLLDGKGKQIAFEQIAVIPMDDKLYCVLKPIDHIKDVESDEAIVFFVNDSQDPPTLQVETDERTAIKVFDIYYSLLDDAMGDEDTDNNNFVDDLEELNKKIRESISCDLQRIYELYDIECLYDLADGLYRIAVGDAPLDDILCELRSLFYNYLPKDSAFSPEKYFDEGIDMLLGFVKYLPSTQLNAKRLYDFSRQWLINDFAIERLVVGDMLKYLSEEEVSKIVEEKAKDAIEMQLTDEPFDKIKNGEKTVEVRLFDEKRRAINVGDMLIFKRKENPKEDIKVFVVALHQFDCFQKMFASTKMRAMAGFADMTATDATEKMYQYYTAEQEQKYGVVGIEFIII